MRVLKLNFISHTNYLKKYDFNEKHLKRTKVQFLVIFTAASRKRNKHPNFIFTNFLEVFGVIYLCIVELSQEGILFSKQNFRQRTHLKDFWCYFQFFKLLSCIFVKNEVFDNSGLSAFLKKDGNGGGCLHANFNKMSPVQ